MLPTQHAYRSPLCALRYHAIEIEIGIAIAIDAPPASVARSP